MVTGGELGEGLGDEDVLLVGRHHEAGVGEVRDLLLHGLDDARVGVAHGGHRDARAEVDQLVAVRVDEDAAGGLLDVDREPGAHARGDRRQLALVQGLRGRTGDGGLQDTLLLDHRSIIGAHGGVATGRRAGVTPSPRPPQAAGTRRSRSTDSSVSGRLVMTPSTPRSRTASMSPDPSTVHVRTSIPRLCTRST